MKKTLGALTTLAMLATALPAFASVNSSSITITSTNRGTIDNVTTARASTGGNFAGAADGGQGDDGGDADRNGAGNGDANAGNGGNGGMGGQGGTVTTGDANTDAGVLNSLNSTDVDLDLRDGPLNSSSLDVVTDNNDIANNIDNTTRSRARTGGNTASGADGGDGDDGGDADRNGAGNGDANSGHGGTGGAGGVDGGGIVDTGVSTSNSGVINLLNTVLVRVRI